MALAFALKARHNFSEAESDMLQSGAGLRAEEIFSALQDGVLPRVFDVLQTTLQHTLRPNAPHTAAGGPLIPDDPSIFITHGLHAPLSLGAGGPLPGEKRTETR